MEPCPASLYEYIYTIHIWYTVVIPGGVSTIKTLSLLGGIPTIPRYLKVTNPRRPLAYMDAGVPARSSRRALPAGR